MTSRIAPATARNASDIAEPPPATGFHTTFQSTNKSLRGGGGGDGPADEESVKVVKEEIERVKTRLEEFERRNGRRTHAVVWVNVLIHGLLLLQTACAGVNLGAYFFNDEWSNSLTWYSIFLYSLNIVLPIIVSLVRFIEQKFVMLEIDDFIEERIYREAYSAIQTIRIQDVGFRSTKTCSRILEVINKMEDALTKKRLDSFSQLLQEIEEEHASAGAGGARVSLMVASIQQPKVQNPNESEVQKVQRLVKNVKQLCRKVDRRVVVRHRVTFWFGVFLHAINLGLSACAGADLGTYPYQNSYHVNWYSIVLFAIIILVPMILNILKAIEQKFFTVKTWMLSEQKIVRETRLAIDKAMIEDSEMNKQETRQTIQQLIIKMCLNLENILIQSKETYDDEVEEITHFK